MTILQDFIQHLSLIKDGIENDTNTQHVFCTSKETYEEWRAFYEEWCKESPNYCKEDDFSEQLLETIDGYSLYRLPEPNMTRLQLPNGDSYVIYSVDIACWY